MARGEEKKSAMDAINNAWHSKTVTVGDLTMTNAQHALQDEADFCDRMVAQAEARDAECEAARYHE